MPQDDFRAISKYGCRKVGKVAPGGLITFCFLVIVVIAFFVRHGENGTRVVAFEMLIIGLSLLVVVEIFIGIGAFASTFWEDVGLGYQRTKASETAKFGHTRVENHVHVPVSTSNGVLHEGATSINNPDTSNITTPGAGADGTSAGIGDGNSADGLGIAAQDTLNSYIND